MGVHDDGGDDDAAAAFRAPLPAAFERRVWDLAPGEGRAFVADEWRDAIVLVARGEVELECGAGGRRRFRTGDLLFAEGLALRRLRNPGAGATVLVALRRRRR